MGSNRSFDPISGKPGETPAHSLACLEIWGGNRRVACPVELPGLSGWISSSPAGPASAGGDVCYLSACGHGQVARILLADVAGHGQDISVAASELRSLIHKHINTWDQSDLMRELNGALRDRTRFRIATAIALSTYSATGCVLFSNAGHPPPLWYHPRDRKWEFLLDDSPQSVQVEGLPLGAISGTQYRQTAIQLEANDLLVLYTDGVSEALASPGEATGLKRLLEIARRLPVDSPAAAGQALLDALLEFRSETTREDDKTLVVLKRIPA